VRYRESRRVCVKIPDLFRIAANWLALQQIARPRKSSSPIYS